MNFQSKSALQTKQFAQKLASTLKGGEVLCFYGDLGAGKTTFISGLVDYFLPNSRVLSPTFIIVRHYSLNNISIKNFYHIDLYRLQNNTGIDELGIVELFNQPDNIIAIEWAERMENLLPMKRVDIRFKIKSIDKRIIQIKI